MSYGGFSDTTFNPTGAGNSAANGVSNIVKQGATGMAQQMGVLPGAQDPNDQQYFQQMHQGMDTMGQALQGMEQPGAGGKSSGGGLFNAALGGGGKGMSFNPTQSAPATGSNQFRGAQTF
jgi:hypothetical protein